MFAFKWAVLICDNRGWAILFAFVRCRLAADSISNQARRKKWDFFSLKMFGKWNFSSRFLSTWQFLEVFYLIATIRHLGFFSPFRVSSNFLTNFRSKQQRVEKKLSKRIKMSIAANARHQDSSMSIPIYEGSMVSVRSNSRVQTGASNGLRYKSAISPNPQGQPGK